jgi:hypothetical protein
MALLELIRRSGLSRGLVLGGLVVGTVALGALGRAAVTGSEDDPLAPAGESWTMSASAAAAMTREGPGAGGAEPDSTYFSDAAGYAYRGSGPATSGQSWTMRVGAAPAMTQQAFGPGGALPATLYVNAAAGSDTQGDGQTPSTAFQTIGRALAEIPQAVDNAWTIHVAAGTYPESVELRRFVMPAMLSNPQLRTEPIGRAIALVGSSGTIIAPPAGTPCVSASGVVLFLDTIGCRTSGPNGITAAGATLVMDDVSIATTAAATHGLYAEMSLVYIGGTFGVSGPFTNGIAVRSNTVARTGTRRNPDTANLTFDGTSSHAIFARDGGNFTSTFETGTIRVTNAGQVMYALLGSRIFLNATMRLELHNVRRGISASQFSAINISQVVLTGTMPNPFGACHKASYVALERVTAPSPRPRDTDGTCNIFTT